MKKTGILHKELAACIAAIGHYDQLSVVSCLSGIPKDTKVIDLALTRGIPSMIDVIAAMEEEMLIEKLIIAEELEANNPELYQYITNKFPTEIIELIPNDMLKQKAVQSKSFVRTGENMRFSNILLQAGYSS